MNASVRSVMRVFAIRGLIALMPSLLLACATGPATTMRPGRSADSENHLRLADGINAYRAARGVPRIAISPALMVVAHAHLEDLERHYRRGTQCNMHSWSNAGTWSACCYTPDHAAASCMWNKPSEITRGRYSAPGYEIVAHHTDPITPARALLIWQESPPHRAMLLNTGSWADNRWQALGAAIGRHYAVVWFAGERDSATE